MRPKLNDAVREFKTVNIGISDVGKLIGGKVDYNINTLTKVQGRFENACAIRMSYVLNNTGFKVPYISGLTVSGKNGDWYLYKVRTLVEYLKKKFGEPEHVILIPTAFKVAKYKGIIIFEVDEWVDASGHATIWNGVNCSDRCYFTKSKKAYIWQLKN